MLFWDFKRNLGSVALMLTMARKHGMDAPALLKGSGIALAQLSDPATEILAAQELRVASNLMHRLGSDEANPGIQLGLNYHASTFGIWGYGMLSSATVADAQSLALRFLTLSFVFTLVSFHEDASTASFVYGEPDLNPKLVDFIVQRDLAATGLILQELIGPDFRATRVALRAQRPSKSPMHRLFGADIEYGAAINTLSFDRQLMSRTLPMANPITAAMCEQMAKQLVDQRRKHASTRNVVTQYLRIPGRTLPNLATMAALLHTSTRTLKRRLNEEHTDFSTLLTEARRELAEEMLAEDSLTLHEITERLGYGDLSTFSQAFKRWTGQPPGTWRRSLASKGE